MTPAKKATAAPTRARTAGTAKATGARANGAAPKARVTAKDRTPAKAPARGAAATKSTSAAKSAKPAPAKRPAAKAATKAATPAKSAPAARKAPAAKAAPATKSAPATRAKATATKPRAARPAPTKGPYANDAKFLEEIRETLLAERAVYLEQANDLKAEAESLAQEREPGDVQFDEESGEGGTVTVDRERDLALSAQALAAVEEIDAALERVTARTYGSCERCHQPIPKPRLKALPYARLCVACKSGGLSRR